MINYKNENELREPTGLNLLLTFLDSAGQGKQIEATLINHKNVRTLKVTPYIKLPRKREEFNTLVMKVLKNTTVSEDLYDAQNWNLLIAMNEVELDHQGQYISMHGDNALEKTVSSIEAYNKNQELADTLFDPLALN